MLRPKTGHPVTAGSHPESANGWRTVGGEGVALPTVEHSYHIDGRLGRGAVFGDGHPNDAVLILTALGRTNRLGEVDSTQDTGRNAARIYTDWVHRVIETENSSSHRPQQRGLQCRTFVGLSLHFRGCRTLTGYELASSPEGSCGFGTGKAVFGSAYRWP